MAALTIPDTGLGGTISGTGLITTFIKSISEVEIAVDELDVTHLATTGYKARRPSDLRNLPEFNVEFYWTGATTPIGTHMVPSSEPYAGTLVTLTLPGAGSLQGTCFVKNVKFPKVAQGEIMMGSYTLAFDGAPGSTTVATNQPTFTAA